MRLILSVFLVFSISFFSCVRESDTELYIRKGGNYLYLNDGTNELFWFDGVHSNDPENIMFADIEKEFLAFNPDLVLVEGRRARNIKKNRDEAIIYGESSFTAFLADKNGILCESIEPPDLYIGAKLLEDYQKNDIIAMIILRQIKQWQRESTKRHIDFTREIVSFVKTAVKEMFDHDDLQVDYTYIQDLLEPIIGFRIDENNWKNVPADEIVYESENLIHTIWQETINLRDRYLVELIEKKKNDYKKIFIMMGFDHALATMDRLKVIYKK